MPMNLPEVVLPVPKSGKLFYQQLAKKLLVGQSTNINVSDTEYCNRNRERCKTPVSSSKSARRLSWGPIGDELEEHLRLLDELSVNGTNVTCGGAEIGDVCFYRGWGCRPVPDTLALDTIDSNLESTSWFQTIDTDANGLNAAPFGFVALPYLPYFSNCEGYDSFVTIAKLTENNTQCHIEPVSSTIWISEYPWKDQFSAVADHCTLSASDLCPNEVLDVFQDPDYGIQVNCYYEEAIYQVRQPARSVGVIRPHLSDFECCVNVVENVLVHVSG